MARFYEATVEGRALRSTSGGQGGEDVEEEESEAEDSDHEGRDYSWKKTIMIGPTYQASVPADLCYYDDTLPYGKYHISINVEMKLFTYIFLNIECLIILC